MKRQMMKMKEMCQMRQKKTLKKSMRRRKKKRLVEMLLRLPFFCLPLLPDAVAIAATGLSSCVRSCSLWP